MGESTLMPGKTVISTSNAPSAIGAYSQAVRHDNVVYISGQIPLSPVTQEVIGNDPRQQIEQVFENLKGVAEAAGGSLDDIIKLTVYLVDLNNFPIVNEVMGDLFNEPFPARAAIGVAALPKGVGVEVEAILILNA